MLKTKMIVGSLIAAIFFFGVLAITKSTQNKLDYIGPPPPIKFENVLEEVQDFYTETTGLKVKTPIRDFNHLQFPMTSGNVFAYCYLQPGNEYIAFNHKLIDEHVSQGNSDFIFQIILHEYTHCEGRVGHIEMFGHFMNDGGAPWLSINEVKKQFKDYVKYYRDFYEQYGKEEWDLNEVHALSISVDSDGNIKTSCSCSSCVK